MTRRALTLEEQLLGRSPCEPGQPCRSKVAFQFLFEFPVGACWTPWATAGQGRRYHVQGPVQSKNVVLLGKHALRVAT